MKDVQRSKCYAWENNYPSLRRVFMLAENVVIYLVRYLDWKVRNMPAKNRGDAYNSQFGESYFQNSVCFTNKKQGEKNAHSWNKGFINGKSIINMKLPVHWALDYAVILHEFAHSIEPRDGHGANWISTYCILLNRFHPSHPSLESLADSLTASKIKFVPFKSNPWYRGFCRVKFNPNNAPAFTKLVTKAWADGVASYSRKSNKTNWKLRVLNLIKKSKWISYHEEEFITYSGQTEGCFVILFTQEAGEMFDRYQEEYVLGLGDDKQAFWKEVYNDIAKDIATFEKG